MVRRAQPLSLCHAGLANSVEQPPPDIFHAVSDHCNSKFLKQAGVDNDFVRLPDIGIHGNSHYLMMEKNSDQIAGLVKFIRGFAK